MFHWGAPYPPRKISNFDRSEKKGLLRPKLVCFVTSLYHNPIMCLVPSLDVLVYDVKTIFTPFQIFCKSRLFFEIIENVLKVAIPKFSKPPENLF